MTRDAAIAILAELNEIPAEYLNDTLESLRVSWRKARRVAHPDRQGGDQTLWDQVEQAAKVLGL